VQCWLLGQAVWASNCFSIHGDGKGLKRGVDIDTNAGALINGVELSAATHEGQVKSAMWQAIEGKGARSFRSAGLRKSEAIGAIRIPFSFPNSRSGTPDTWIGPCRITKERQRRIWHVIEEAK
jgi:hypothetical protein